MKVKLCLQCKKFFGLKQKSAIFCSTSCKSKYHEKNRKKREYKLICDNCQKEYVGTRNRTKKEDLKFCCSKCKFEYNSRNNEEKECVICGKKFTPVNARHLCCCRKCKDEYKNYKEERICKVCGNNFHSFRDNKDTCSEKCFKELKSFQTLNNLKKGKYPNTFTQQHKKVNTFLKDLRITYQNEKRFERYSIDIFLDKYNLCIEIMGKYWHQDCRHFPLKSNYISQKGVIFKDAKKRKKIEKENNTKILYLWEDEINNNEKLCKALILRFIKNPYKLKSYQSSSYTYNNKLRYSSKNKKQYFEYAMND